MAELISLLLPIAILGYLLGSIPFGYLLVRLFRGEDIRASGSGNIGATNVARSSPLLGAATLLLDAAKGFSAVLITRHVFAATQGASNLRLLMCVAALAAVLGHVFPVWLKFRGGKGVATGLGSFLLIAPKSILVVAGIFLLVVAAFRYVSLGSIVAVALFPMLAWWMDRRSATPSMIALVSAASLLIVAKHHENIRRLLTGTESRFQWRRG